MKKELREKGFTLIELSIVMIIIGLLIGAVLKGQAMIDDAKNKRLMNDIQGISVAYFSYLDKYNAFPGDDPGANARWGSVAAGDGNGQIGGAELTPGGESQEAWQALRFAGLLSGDPNATGPASLPRHPYGDVYGIGDLIFANGIGIKNRILVNDIPAEVANIIDIKFDDGVFDTGTVQSSAAYVAGTIVDLSYAL
ncbi:MAG: type II secretion system protein [Nitrospirae bacterium]|nr:type II secretion system protein [Nitrospirota bacterium]